jgi:hypothetical protein
MKHAVCRKLVIFLFVFYRAYSQTEAPVTMETEIGNDGSTEPTDNIPPSADYDVLVKLQTDGGDLLDEQQLVMLATVLGEIKKDPETPRLVQQIKDDAKNQGMKVRQDMKPRDFVESLLSTFEDSRKLDELFQDPDRALEELIRKGMVDPDGETIEQYKKDPKKPEMETRTSVYVTFVSIAAEGGYL